MKDISKLLEAVETFYKKEGRGYLPWRKTKDPYRILVSEVMLQQTQVERVVPFYNNFLASFPTPEALSQAPLSKVLKAWQGLGYNRRAKFLQAAAKAVVSMHRGRFPKQVSALETLQGVGPYTARAVATFAYNSPEVFIETNIRTVFMYFCFRKPGKDILYFSQVSDVELLTLVEEALEKTKLEPRDFYAALMDYGAKLKRDGVKLNKQSKHYIKQSKFEGSARQLRGALLRELLHGPATLRELLKKIPREKDELEAALLKLMKEELVKKKGRQFAVAK